MYDAVLAETVSFAGADGDQVEGYLAKVRNVLTAQQEKYLASHDMGT